MTAATPATDAPPGSGWLAETLTQLFMKRAVVVEREQLAEGFHLLTLASPQFRAVDWIPGHKLQVRTGSRLETRTYTPIEWNRDDGTTRILGHAHGNGPGNGPGSAWVGTAQAGTPCHVFGPRASLDLRAASGPVTVFGDETSIGLLHALAQQAPGRDVGGALEVAAAAPARQVLARLGLRGVELVERQPQDTHLRALEHSLAGLAATGATFVLTGKAPSIQYLRRALKGLGVPSGRIATKAYWAPGKTGLD